MGFPPWERSVTCTYIEPPRAAGPLVATMDILPATLLRSPSSVDPEGLVEIADWSGEADSSRTAESIPSWTVTWDKGRESSCR
jgi:hypothetical protein